MTTAMVIFVVALAFVGASTPMVRRLALKLGFVAVPRGDRAHRRPTALMGGVAIYAGASLALLLATWLVNVFLGPRFRLPELLGILAGASLMALIGLFDDRSAFQPRLKLALQLVPVIVVIAAGVQVNLPVPEVVNWAVTVFWLLYVTNAVNYLDNMDGIAAMIAAVSGAFFTLIAVLNGQYLVSMLAAALTGASIGFARYNLPLPRAQIFMGDAGSLFLGFMLAVLGIKLRVPSNTNLVTWMVPVFVLGLPILDTALVFVSRRRRGVSFFQGGVDHTTHRLQRLGLDNLSVALAMGLLNAGLGIVATFMMQADIKEAYASAGGLLLLAIYVIWRIEFRANDEIRAGQANGRSFMQVIAHRGASSYAPENTVPAFDLAIQMGADGLETDIRATSDGVLVLLHDAEVGRTTDGQGPVADLSWEQVSQLDAGSWFAPRFAGARIMTLDEFLERYGGRLSLALEVKAPDIEPLVVRALRGRAWLHQVTVTSFSWQTCWEAHRLMPELRVGWLMRDLDADAIQRAEEAGLAQICPPAEGLTSQWVAQAHARGLEVRAWGVRDEALMRGAVEAGVEGMTVNFPDKLLAHLRARGLR